MRASSPPWRSLLSIQASCCGRLPSYPISGTPYPHESATRSTSTTTIARAASTAAGDSVEVEMSLELAKTRIADRNHLATTVQADDPGRPLESAEHDHDPAVLAQVRHRLGTIADQVEITNPSRRENPQALDRPLRRDVDVAVAAARAVATKNMRCRAIHAASVSSRPSKVLPTRAIIAFPLSLTTLSSTLASSARSKLLAAPPHHASRTGVMSTGSPGRPRALQDLASFCGARRSTPSLAEGGRIDTALTISRSRRQ